MNGTQNGTHEMNYLVKKNGRYYFNRRVPTPVAHLDPRKLIRLALNTDSKQVAMKVAFLQNEKLEWYWNDLLINHKKYAEDAYQALLERAELFGFTYLCNRTLASALTVEDIIDRFSHVAKNKLNHDHVEAVLGGKTAPEITLSNALERYWEYSKPKLIHKSEDQIRKWKNPRKRAVENYIKCNGDKPIQKTTREDTLRFRDWWIDKMKEGNLVSATADKDFVHVKTIMESVSDNMRLNMDIKYLFKKLVLSLDDSSERKPFETNYLINTFLNHENLIGLNPQAKGVLFVMAETGASVSELVGLLPEDIILNHTIPHIVITPRSKKMLKTKYRKRVIPIVGFALDIFKEFPNGFTQYQYKSDSLSNTLNKFLTENKLFPSDHHTVYSLRHSFQDRLLAANAPDRVQADLMGHKFGRQAYGNGASLEQKLNFLEKVALKKVDISEYLNKEV